VRFVHRDRTRDAADGFHGPDIAQVAERNLLAIWRNVGCSREADRFLSVKE
jgi:hypothetical protein